MSSGSCVVPCRPTDGCTDTLKLIVTFYNFLNMPKNVFGSEIDTDIEKVRLSYFK
jgi:hypothetical protein